MSSRNRSSRINGSRRQRRSLPPLLESLENRLVLSNINPVPTNVIPITVGTPVASPFGHRSTDGSSTAVGLSPNQVRAAYGMDQVTFGTSPNTIQGDGAGQTIAIVIWGDNLSLEPTTSPSYAGSALQVFDKTFGLPDPPSFQIYTQNGQVGRTGTNLAYGRRDRT